MTTAAHSTPADDLIEVARTRTSARLGRARAVRESAGVSVSEVARALGVEPSTVLRWEQGQRRPRGDLARRYGRLLAQLEDVVASCRAAATRRSSRSPRPSSR